MGVFFGGFKLWDILKAQMKVLEVYSSLYSGALVVALNKPKNQKDVSNISAF